MVDIILAEALNMRLLFLVFLVLWKTLITRYGGRVTEALDASSLAKITDGYTPGHMVQAIQQILTERRVQQVCNERKTTNCLHFSTL